MTARTIPTGQPGYTIHLDEAQTLAPFFEAVVDHSTLIRLKGAATTMLKQYIPTMKRGSGYRHLSADDVAAGKCGQHKLYNDVLAEACAILNVPVFELGDLPALETAGYEVIGKGVDDLRDVFDEILNVAPPMPVAPVASPYEVTAESDASNSFYCPNYSEGHFEVSPEMEAAIAGALSGVSANPQEDARTVVEDAEQAFRDALDRHNADKAADHITSDESFEEVLVKDATDRQLHEATNHGISDLLEGISVINQNVLLLFEKLAELRTELKRRKGGSPTHKRNAK